jgi:ATP-dependent Zn protease
LFDCVYLYVVTIFKPALLCFSFHQNEGVIVLGATNRRDDLDKALLRPGRFDVEVNVSISMPVVKLVHHVVQCHQTSQHNGNIP